MDKLNILNKTGYLTKEDRKEPLSHGCNWVYFESCIDLSKTIYVTAYSNCGEIPINLYSIDLASFFSWWTLNVHKDLNGFSGFGNLKFEFTNFNIM